MLPCLRLLSVMLPMLSVEEEWSVRGVLALCVVEDPRGVQLEKDDPTQGCLIGKMNGLNLES